MAGVGTADRYRLNVTDRVLAERSFHTNTDACGVTKRIGRGDFGSDFRMKLRRVLIRIPIFKAATAVDLAKQITAASICF